MIKNSLHSDATESLELSVVAKKKLGRPQKNEPGLVRINVQVSAAEHKKLKVYVAQNDTTITHFFKDVIANLP